MVDRLAHLSKVCIDWLLFSTKHLFEPHLNARSFAQKIKPLEAHAMKAPSPAVTREMPTYKCCIVANLCVKSCNNTLPSSVRP